MEIYPRIRRNNTAMLLKWPYYPKQSIHLICVSVCPTLYISMDCSPLGSSVHGIFQARILEWVAILFFRGFSWSRDQTQVSFIVSRFFYHLSHKGSPYRFNMTPVKLPMTIYTELDGKGGGRGDQDGKHV